MKFSADEKNLLHILERRGGMTEAELQNASRLDDPRFSEAFRSLKIRQAIQKRWDDWEITDYGRRVE